MPIRRDEVGLKVQMTSKRERSAIFGVRESAARKVGTTTTAMKMKSVLTVVAVTMLLYIPHHHRAHSPKPNNLNINHSKILS